MRRIILFLFALLTAFPVIGQEQVQFRSCRPGLENVRHEHKSALRRAGTATVNKYKGDRRQLVVMAAFADQGFLGDSAQTMTQWNKIFNTEYLSEGTFYGSVHDYFIDQSYGQFRLTFDLYYTTVDSMAKYRSTYTDDENSKYLVQDVSKVLMGKVDDWAPYDWDNDGEIDQLLIIYAGKGKQAGGGTNTIWAHQWWLSEHKNASPVKVDSIGKDYFIDAYCCVQELSGEGDYGSFGTLCHEYSHCFGLPDFYTSNGTLLGGWDIMDNGNYNGGGFRPCNYSSYERAFLGWLTPEELKNEGTVSLPALQTQAKAFLIRNEAWPDEYYLVEYRQRAGWDSMLPGSGILIFHVDYDEQEFMWDWVNSDRRNRYSIFPANNDLDEHKNWAYPYNGNNSLTNTTEPAAELNNLNSDSTFLMSKPLTEMSVSKSMASFRFQNMFTVVSSIKEAPFGGEWFTIDGRRIEGMPDRKGLYIHEGKVVLVR